MSDYGLIYKITNKVNGKVYVGQTIRSIQDRWKDHICMTSGSSRPIKNAIKKYGKESFSIEVLAKAENQEQLDVLERNFIKDLNAIRPNGYNIKDGGKTGCKFTFELRKKISDSSKKRWADPEARLQQSLRRKAFCKTEAGQAHIQKLSRTGLEKKALTLANYWSTHDRSSALEKANAARLQKMREKK